MTAAVLGLGQMNTLIALTAITGGVSGTFESGGYRSAFYVKYTKGDETNCALKFEFSEDDVTYVHAQNMDVTLTGSQNVRYVTAPVMLGYKYVKVTATPNADGTGTVVCYARRLDAYFPFVEAAAGAATESAFDEGEDTPSGVAQQDASAFIGQFGYLIGSASAGVVAPTTAGSTARGTCSKNRADSASIECVYAKGAETNNSVVVEFPLGDDWYTSSTTTFTESGTYHIPVRDMGAWEQSFRVSAVRSGSGVGTIKVRARAHTAALFS